MSDRKGTPNGAGLPQGEGTLPYGALRYERAPAAIYAQSFETVRHEARLERFDTEMQRLVIRLIHSCGMVDVADRLAFSKGAYLAGHEALQNGAPILCDCEMVGAGIIRRYLPADNEVIVTRITTVFLRWRKQLATPAPLPLWNYGANTLMVQLSPSAMHQQPCFIC